MQWGAQRVRKQIGSPATQRGLEFINIVHIFSHKVRRRESGKADEVRGHGREENTQENVQCLIYLKLTLCQLEHSESKQE